LSDQSHKLANWFALSELYPHPGCCAPLPATTNLLVVTCPLEF